MTDQPTQPLTDEDLAVMQGAVERAELFDEETLPLAFSDRKRLLAEVFRLRAENTALAAKLGTILSYVNQPTTPERAAGMVTVRRFVNDLMGVKSEPNQWEQMTRPALGLDQDEEGQANG